VFESVKNYFKLRKFASMIKKEIDCTIAINYSSGNMVIRKKWEDGKWVLASIQKTNGDWTANIQYYDKTDYKPKIENMSNIDFLYIIRALGRMCK